MTTDQVNDAIRQLHSFCRAREEIKDYESMSARGVLYDLGYEEDEADEVLVAIYQGGFTHCLDPSFKGQGVYPDFVPEYPPAFACYWGPDQLRSRVHWVM
jgi:hypothetical protein